MGETMTMVRAFAAAMPARMLGPDAEAVQGGDALRRDR